MHVDAARVLSELGGDPSGFVARQLTATIASEADLVITMTRAHRNAVLELAPRLLRRTFTLAEAAHLVTDCGARCTPDLAELRPRLGGQEIPDIADPIGRPAEVHRQVGFQIAGLLPPILRLSGE